MKGEFTMFLMSFLGALSHPTNKLLKVPRIYNALITSDENLLPSQAYPALAPVVQGVQIPLPGFVSTGVYRTAVIPNQVQLGDGRSFSYSVKEDFYHYNFVETGQPFKFDIPKIPEEKSFYEPTTLFRPLVPADQGPSQFVDRNVYFESSPTQQGEETQNSPPKGILEHAGTAQRSPQPNLDSLPKSNVLQSKISDDTENETNKEDPQQSVARSENENHHQNLDINNSPQFDELVKNNRPKDPSIVDVPPPPLPIGRKSDTKKEEFPPPPVPFI